MTRDRDCLAVVAVTVTTSLGSVHVAATGRGLVAAALLASRATFDSDLGRRLGRAATWIDARSAASGASPDPEATMVLRDAERALGALDAGDGGPGLALPIDLSDRPAWDRAVLDAVRSIPRGETRSYGEIARMVGRSGAARAVGGAVGRNPIALVIPCHRVIAGDGTLGGYGGGWWGERERLLDLKAQLLAREGRVVPRTRQDARPEG